MTSRQNTQGQGPATVLYAAQARALVVQVTAGRVGADVRAVFRWWRVGRSVLAVLAVLVELGAWKPGGWTGHYSELEQLTGMGERQIRRAMKALRAVRLVAGDPLDAQQAEDGRFYRDAGTYRVVLPWWATARHWRPKAASSQVGPTGHFRPDSRVISSGVPGTPIDGDRKEAPPPPRSGENRIPGDYLEAKARLGRRWSL